MAGVSDMVGAMEHTLAELSRKVVFDSISSLSEFATAAPLPGLDRDGKSDAKLLEVAAQRDTFAQRRVGPAEHRVHQ